MLLLFTGCSKEKADDVIIKTEESISSIDETPAVSSTGTSREPYIVENQEYVYSVDGDIGQLGEEGYYYSAKEYDTKNEILIYETVADITHDCIGDLIRVVGYRYENIDSSTEVVNGQEGCFVKMYRGIENGKYEDYAKFINRGLYMSHAGNGTICISHKESKDYLLIANIYEIQGTANYNFAAIYVDDNDGIVIDDTYGVEFAVDKESHPDNWNEYPHREELLPVFRERMSPYSEDSVLLLSLDIDNEALYSSVESVLSGNYYFETVLDKEE